MGSGNTQAVGISKGRAPPGETQDAPSPLSQCKSMKPGEGGLRLLLLHQTLSPVVFRENGGVGTEKSNDENIKKEGGIVSMERRKDNNLSRRGIHRKNFGGRQICLTKRTDLSLLPQS